MNGCKNARNPLVAATFEKANTYVFAAPTIRDREVGGSNPLAGVPTTAGMTWLILDFGAGGVSLISKDHARLFGLDPESKEQRLRYEVAPGFPIDSPVLVTDMIMDGNLGQPFMSQYIITFDLAHSRLWLTRPK
ncbi:MAG TPA: hypothetical protein VKB05_11860 [Pyrinomonadaceae bacterium]|nr:hypothetical protein [Pyrinomonadaceae bacterium]